MNRAMFPILTAMLMLVACNSDDAAVPDEAEAAAGVPVTAPEVTFNPKANGMTTAKLKGPVQIKYRIIGEPIVGQPVAIDLQFASSMGTASFDVTYRVNDTTALSLPEAQPASVTIAPSSGDEFAAQQVTVVPMREGRLYLNIAATVESDTGSISSVTAVPLQVGQAPRELLENGQVTIDENGELIRTLPAKQN